MPPAETQVATIGYNGQFWLSTTALAAALVEMKHVREFDIAGDGQRQQVQSTHLKSPGYRHEYIPGFYDDTDFTVSLNSRPLSITDATIETARSDGTVRYFKQVLPEGGVPTSQVTGTCKCIGYNRGRVTGEGLLEATATFRIVTVDAIVPYLAP